MIAGSAHARKMGADRGEYEIGIATELYKNIRVLLQVITLLERGGDAPHASLMARGPKGEKRPTDAFQRARMVAQIATGEIEEPAPKGPGPTASEMGKKGGAARTKALDPERRKQIAKKAAAKRWTKKAGS